MEQAIGLFYCAVAIVAGIALPLAVFFSVVHMSMAVSRAASAYKLGVLRARRKSVPGRSVWRVFYSERREGDACLWLGARNADGDEIEVAVESKYIF